jgi:subtilisin family serine protease
LWTVDETHGAIVRPLASMSPLELVRLRALMALGSGSASVSVGLMDGPVAAGLPDLAAARIRSVGGGGAVCARVQSSACAHGTFVAGILVARRGSPAPGICPGCTLLVRPIFGEATTGGGPTATPQQVGRAIVECVHAGTRILNLSAATGEPSTRHERELRQALDFAARRGVLVVAAAGNRATLGSSAITRHPAVIPVVAYDRGGQPMSQSTLGSSAGRRGLGAPGEAIVSLGADGRAVTRAGTSFAAAFVTGTIALLWSLFPRAGASQIKRALSQGRRRTTVIPPLLDAQAAHAAMAAASRPGRVAG